VCGIPPHLFDAIYINKMDLPPLHAMAVLFPFTVSQAFPPSQFSISSCLSPDGTFDVDKHRQYAASLLAGARGQSATILSNMVGGGESHATFVEQQSNSAFVKSCTRRCVLGRKDTEDGPLCVITPVESAWYCAYVSSFLLDEAYLFTAKMFRNRFCLLYPSYKDLLHQIKSDDNRFERWCGHKCNGKKSSPIELLLLGSLRYLDLGHGWTFDNIEEQTAISVSVHHNFFHKFIEFGSTTLYSMHVITPVHLAEAQSNIAEYTEAGFPGCVGSADCTQITMEGGEYNLKKQPSWQQE